MFIDKKGRLFGKISIIDVLIVAFAIAVACMAAFKWGWLGTARSVGPFIQEAHDILIEFYQEEAPDFVVKAAKIGDNAVEALKNTSFGRVVDIKVGKSVSWVKTESGEYVASSKEGYLNVIIVMETTGFLGSGGAKIGGEEYFIGRTIDLYAGRAAFRGRISGIAKKGQELP